MKRLFCVILFLMVATLLANPVISVSLVVDIDPHDSGTNSQDVYPTSPAFVEPTGKDSKSEIILLLSIGLVGIAGVGKKRFGKNSHDEDITP